MAIDIIDKVQGKISDVAGKAAQLVYGAGNIDALKAGISKHGGMATQNRFQVVFSPPSATLLNLNAPDIIGNIIAGDFDIRNLVNDPRDIALFASRAAFPSWNIPTFEYQTTGVVNKFPYTVIQEDLTISFIVPNDYFIKKLFDNWMTGIVNVDNHITNYKDSYAVDIVVSQLNEKHIPTYSYKFQKAFPTIMTAMEFDQGGSEFQKFDVTFAYDKFIPQGLLKSNTSMVSTGFGALGLPDGSTLAQKASTFTKGIKSPF